jgi:DNA repair protein RecO (recombination protein O)
MIQKTTGIVLRVSPFSRTSHVVTWLTPDHGRLTTVVKGALRPKSLFLGQYDLFYRCEVLFYSRERNGAHLIRECSPLDTRPMLRTNWRASVCASYICDLALKVSRPGNESIALFRAVDAGLDLAGNSPSPLVAMLQAELAVLHAIGLSPQLYRCATCGLPVGKAGSEGYGFSCAGGGVLCETCRQKHSHPGVVEVPAASVMLMQHWQRPAAEGDISSPAGPIPDDGTHLVQIGGLLGTFFEYHIHASPLSRRIATDLLH